MTLDELNGSLGTLILSAALKDNHLSIQFIFDVTFRGGRHRASFSEKRFLFLLDCLIDCEEILYQHKKLNKLSAVRQIWNVLIENYIKHYRPSSYVTIDKQSIGFLRNVLSRFIFHRRQLNLE